MNLQGQFKRIGGHRLNEAIKESDDFESPDKDAKKFSKDYPHSAPRVYLVMMNGGPFRIFKSEADAKAEVTSLQDKYEDWTEGIDIRAYVEDLPFIR